jgi:hypothetical protein
MKRRDWMSVVVKKMTFVAITTTLQAQVKTYSLVASTVRLSRLIQMQAALQPVVLRQAHLNSNR